MFEPGKHHRNGLIPALLGTLFLFAFTSNALGGGVNLCTLDQQYGFYLQNPGAYFTDYRGQGEKYFRGTVSANGYTAGIPWYYIMPNGEVFEFTPELQPPYYNNPSLVGVLLANVGTEVYNDPALLHDACENGGGQNNPKFCVGDFVWKDLDCDGIQDYDEPGVEGVMVQAVEWGTENQIGTTVYTNEKGEYWLCFGTTPPPPFYLCFVLPEEYVVCKFTKRPKGANWRRNSDVNMEGCTDKITWPPSSNNYVRYTISGVDAGVCCDDTPRCKGIICDFVWFDKNCDGIQDRGEKGIKGVELCLVNLGDPDFAECTTTDRNGFYQFSGLCAGDYLVTVNPDSVPFDYAPTFVGVGDDPAKDSDEHKGADVTLPTNYSKNPTIDFGYCSPCAGEIGDYVWFDKNCDGIQDDSEVGIEGVEVCLYIDANPDVFVDCTTTNADGHYLFTGLCPGQYNVRVTSVPDGFTRTSIFATDPAFDSNPHDGAPVTLDDEEPSDLTIDFGYCAPCTGEIGDFVWDDGSVEDCNGKQDVGEGGLAGISVCLYIDADPRVFLACTTTDEFGFYHFMGLCDGAYIVSVDTASVPPGYTPTTVEVAGSTSDNDSDDPAGTRVILIGGDDADPTIDFGYCLECRECSGGVTELTLAYKGTLPFADIEVFDKKSTSLFQGVASPGSDFTFSGMDKDGKMGTEISVFVNGFLNTKIHTSCSRPIGPGLVSGDFEVVGGTSLRGGPLCPLDPPNGDCGPCKGKVTQLELMYTGGSAATIRVEQKKDGKIVFQGLVPAFGSLEFSGMDKGTLGTEISVFVGGSLNTTIHTSCSQPIGPGMVFGDFEVVSGRSKDGGPLCIGSDDDDKKGGKKSPKKAPKKGRKKGRRKR